MVYLGVGSAVEIVAFRFEKKNGGGECSEPLGASLRNVILVRPWASKTEIPIH
jgi:hypothetical protein